MKRWILFFIVAIVAAGVMVDVYSAEAPKIPKDWRDLLPIKPSYEWQQAYGFGPASFLAHGQWQMKQLLDGQGAVIAEMKKEIDALNAKVKDMEKVRKIPVVAPDLIDPNNSEVK